MKVEYCCIFKTVVTLILSTLTKELVSASLQQEISDTKMPPKQDNVARLLAAEERRNKLVSDAKARKAAKVKQAKADAERDVGEFRKEKDAEFEAFRSQMLGGADSENIKLVHETDKQIVEMKQLSSKRIDGVANLVANMVVAVTI